jgi:hypothetical protein
MMADLKDEMLDAFMAIAPKRGKSRKFTLLPCGKAALARRSQADVARSVAFQREINGATGIPETPAEKRPKPTEELRPDPSLTDAEYFHQRRVKPGKDVGKAPVLVNKLELIGGLARLGGVKEWQEAAAAKYRLLHERSQIGGAKAIDYAAVKVDTSGPSEDAVFIVGANARAEYRDAVQFLGMIRSNLVERVVVYDQSIGKIAGRSARARSRTTKLLLDALDDLAVHFGLAARKAA